MTPKKVKFKGEEFWFLQNEDGSGALAYLDQCNDDGHIASLGVAIFADSFAHVCTDGNIRRYRKVIGHKGDLV